MQIPQEQREQVEEVTMDFSDSMFAVVTEAFPNAAIVIDCFHIVKRCIEAVEELRLKAKREAQKAQNKDKAMFKKKLEQLVKSRKYYRKKHPKKGFFQCVQDKGGSHAHVRADPSSGNH